MGSCDVNNPIFYKTFPTLKVKAVETTLQQTLANFREIVFEFEELHLERENFRSLLLKKEKQDIPACNNCGHLKQDIAAKEQLLVSVASALTKLYKTKDFSIFNQIFELIKLDTDILTPPKEKDDEIKKPPNEDEFVFASPKVEKSTFIEDVSCADVSVSEIEGTPTGRKSPIIQSKKKKSLSLIDKKKCPDTWPTPEKKTMKLVYPTPIKSKGTGGRLRQSRLNLMKVKSTSVVDLTCSPEFSRTSSPIGFNVQNNIKKELMDNEDTIHPSPTSGAMNFDQVYRSMSKDSPSKLKNPLLTARFKIEAETNKRNVENQPSIKNEKPVEKQGDDSSNIFKQIPNKYKFPVKQENVNDETHCPDDSISLLHHVKKIDSKIIKLPSSPTKRPLVENLNAVNTQKNFDCESSLSILRKEPASKAEEVKWVKPNIEPVYKEPTVRKKAEKWSLPGWSCDECKNFYAELYKDNPEMLSKKMEECSKHRGRNNPVRPRTPEGFWNPRWDVPEDTEEFNRRNNAL